MIQHCEQMIANIKASPISDIEWYFINRGRILFYGGMNSKLLNELRRWESLLARYQWASAVPRKPLRRCIDGRWHDPAEGKE